MEYEKLIENVKKEVYDKLNLEIEQEQENINTSQSSSNISSKLASMVDHTLLKPDVTVNQIKKLCEQAKEYKFASVCVNSWNVPLAYQSLYGSRVKVCAVVGFPLGAATTRTKVEETREAIENGATEVDMVINVGALKSGDIHAVKNDIESVVIAARGRAKVKVIIETCLLTDEEKVKACSLSKIAGADFVKTSTGFSTGGATVEDIRLMRKTVGPEMGVKASGGVKDYATAIAMVDAGANRLGTSSGIAIANGKGDYKKAY